MIPKARKKEPGTLEVKTIPSIVPMISVAILKSPSDLHLTFLIGLH